MAKEKEFLNPFTEGVSYVQFIEAMGKQTVAEYCKDKLTKEEIVWLETELSILNKK